MLSELIKPNAHCFAMELVDEDYLSFEDLAIMCIKRMSEDEIIDMFKSQVPDFELIAKEYSYVI